MEDEPMIKAFMIYLGTNMWNESDCLKRFNKNDPKYYTSLYTSRSAWRKVTDYIASLGFNTLLIDIGEGLMFESHPEIACRGAWTKAEMKAEIDRLKALGITCIPKLNFASTHDAWLGEYSHMLGTPLYYKVVKDLIDETCELFAPPLFHIGFDEESRRESHMQNAFGYISFRFGKEYADGMNFCIDCVLKNKVRPWMWAGLALFHADEFFLATSRDAVISTYNYDQIKNIPPDAPDYYLQMQDSAKRLDKHGFDQLPAVSTCYDYYSVDDSLEKWKGEISSEHLLGYITAPWCRTGDDDVYSLMADAKIFDAAMKKYYPEDIK